MPGHVWNWQTKYGQIDKIHIQVTVTRDDVDFIAATPREWYRRNRGLISSRRQRFSSIPKLLDGAGAYLGFFSFSIVGPTSGLKWSDMTVTNNMRSVYTVYKKGHLCFIFWGKKCLRVGRFSGKSVIIISTRQFLISFGTPNMLTGILWFSSIFREGCCILPRSDYHVFLPKLPSSKLPFPATLGVVEKPQQNLHYCIHDVNIG